MLKRFLALPSLTGASQENWSWKALLQMCLLARVTCLVLELRGFCEVSACHCWILLEGRNLTWRDGCKPSFPPPFHPMWQLLFSALIFSARLLSTLLAPPPPFSTLLYSSLPCSRLYFTSLYSIRGSFCGRYCKFCSR